MKNLYFSVIFEFSDLYLEVDLSDIFRYFGVATRIFKLISQDKIKKVVETLKIRRKRGYRGMDREDDWPDNIIWDLGVPKIMKLNQNFILFDWGT